MSFRRQQLLFLFSLYISELYSLTYYPTSAPWLQHLNERQAITLFSTYFIDSREYSSLFTAAICESVSPTNYKLKLVGNNWEFEETRGIDNCSR